MKREAEAREAQEPRDEVIERYECGEIDFERLLTELFVRDVGLRVRGVTRNG